MDWPVTLVLAVVGWVAVLCGAMVWQVNEFARLRNEALDAAGQPPPGTADALNPEALVLDELALLAGGPARLLRICVTDLYLGGWLCWSHGSDGPELLPSDSHRGADPADLEPVRRSIVEAVARGGSLPLADALGRAAAPERVRQMLRGLADRGLCTDAEGLHRLRRGIGRGALVLGHSTTVVLTAGLLGVVGTFGRDPLLAVALGLLAALAVAACAVLPGRFVQLADPRSGAGRTLLEQERKDHVGAGHREGASKAQEDQGNQEDQEERFLTRERALRRIAAFGALGVRRSRPVRRGDPGADAGAAVHWPTRRGNADSGSEGVDPVRLWEVVNRVDEPKQLAVPGPGGIWVPARAEWSPELWGHPARVPGWRYGVERPPAEHG